MSGEVRGLADATRCVRAIARRLVLDAEVRDDLVQDACLAYVQRGEGAPEVSRGWLAEVLRNLWRQRLRTERRRLRREALAARREAQDAAADVVERAATHRRVLEELLGLEEPYRETLLLRYLEGLTPKRIAARTGVPVATVKTRLCRGLHRLRERFDRPSGNEGRSSRSLLISLLLPPPGQSSSLWSLAIMDAKAKIGLAGALAAMAFLAVWLPMSIDRSESPRVEIGAAPELEAAAAPVNDGPSAAPMVPVDASPFDPASEVREVAATGSRHEDRSASRAVAVAATLRGRVLDGQGAPVGGIRMRFVGEGAPPAGDRSPPALSGRSDGEGWFSMPQPSASGHVESGDEAWATLLECVFDPSAPERACVVVVAPTATLQGRVLDDARRPVAGAEVTVGVGVDLRASIPHVLDGSRDASWRAVSGADGSFRVAGVAAHAGARLQARATGLCIHEQPFPVPVPESLEIVLRRPVPKVGLLQGQVLDRHGRVVPGAFVAMARAQAVTDELGLFALDLARSDFLTDVRAVKPGFLPGVVSLPKGSATAMEDWPSFVVINLGPPALEIRGTVVDAESRPRAGFRVGIAEPGFYGAFRDRTSSVEAVIAESEGPMGEVATTGEDGAFTIHGLLDREYRLRAFDPETLLTVDHGPVHPSKGPVTIVVPEDAVYPTLRGTVVDDRGSPVPNATVRVSIDSATMQDGDRALTTFHERRRTATSVVTDAEGRFELEDVPRDIAYLRVDGDRILPLEWGRGVRGGIAALLGSGEEATITVSVRCHFRVQLPDGADQADAFELLTGDGRPLIIDLVKFGSRRSYDRGELVGGRSPVLSAPSTARTLVLYSGDREVGRSPVVLTPEGVTVLPQ